MHTIHRADSRGFANHGWLRSFHTFSFADYYDPARMGFGALRVINDDTIAPQHGFGRHPHRDMEIVSVPLAGSLRHEDSTGNRYVITPGEIQIMSAGTGILHSEHNASASEATQLLQIWVLPKVLGVSPRYEQQRFSEEQRKNRIQLLVSPDGRAGSLKINQDAFFAMSKIEKGQTVEYSVDNSTHGVYIFTIEGELGVANELLKDRDAIGITEAGEKIQLSAQSNVKVLIIEVPMTA